MQTADEIVYASPDSDLSVAEHLIEEVAPICIEMRQFDRADEVVLQAVVLCDKHPEALRYRETAFDAMYFLGRIRVMAGKYLLAEEAFDEAESRVSGTYFAFKKPLCPEDVRVKAAEEKKRLASGNTPGT